MKCPKCQTELPESANFCLECGQGLNAEEQPTVFTVAPDAERKRVTALFSDLTGYTAMTERLDPEEVKEITVRVFDGVKAIVRKYEGFIEKYAGDGVLALFGVPKAHEDDPIRAIRAAQEIHTFVEDLSPRYQDNVGSSLTMHSGINTGLVVTADVDPEKGTHGVTGEAINVAARLSGLAGARDILVGPDTFRASQNYFTFEALKPAKVKGKSEHISIYKLLSENTQIARVGREMQISSEMIGRDQELAKLELQILKAVDGKGSVVNVVGEPGVGKSRLLAELRQRDVVRRVSLLEGRSISIGKNLSFHPIIDLFKQWARIKDDDSQVETSRKLETAIRRVCGDETDEVFPFVATMMGMKLSGKHAKRVEGIEGEALEKLILKNVRTLLSRSSEIIPVVIVMEDLHWADTTSLELLESLFRLTQTCRVVFINVFRPGYWEGDNRKVETIPDWLPDVNFVEIRIRPLDKTLGEALVDNILQVKGLQSSIRQQIVERSGGNPFFMEEIVRSLIDEGAVLQTNSGLEVTEKINDVVIPHTINDVLIARIDRLEEQTRELIKVASVIGRSFFDRILKEVADSIESVDDRLAYLKDIQFIRDRTRMEELEYLFKHALAKEAAYESTLIQQRKLLHTKVAQSIERIFQERLPEFYGMLAFHYSKGDDLVKAEEYMARAGEEALRSSASNEAIHYFQEALRFYLAKYGQNADQENLATFEKQIGIALHNRGQWQEATRYFDSVLKRWGSPLPKRNFFGIVKLAWDIFILKILVHFNFSKSKEIPSSRDKEIFEQCCKASESLAFFDYTRSFQVSMSVLMYIRKFNLLNVPGAGGYLAGIASMFSLGGLSFKTSNRLLEISRQFRDGDNPRDITEYSCFKTMIKHCQGRWEEITNLDWNLLKSSIEIGDFWHATHYLWSYNIIQIEIGKFENSLKSIQKLYEIGEEYSYPHAILCARTLESRHFLLARKLNEALQMSEEGLRYAQENGTDVHVWLFLSIKAESHRLLNDPNSALEFISQAKSIYDKQVSVMRLHKAPFLTTYFFINVTQLALAIHSEIRSELRYLQRLPSIQNVQIINVNHKISGV
jgi:class 3 adenylate cyclase/tetratricopeptide (TPR) repeat protein